MRNLQAKVLLLLMLIAVTAFAAETPVTMMDRTANQMIDALKQNRSKIKQNPNYVESLARKILLPHVDVTIMSRLALGRNGWKAATSQQRQKFTSEFTILLMRTRSTLCWSKTPCVSRCKSRWAWRLPISLPRRAYQPSHITTISTGSGHASRSTRWAIFWPWPSRPVCRRSST